MSELSEEIQEQIDEIEREYGIDNRFDHYASDELDGGAVAATAQIPEIDPIEGYEDFLKSYDDLVPGAALEQFSDVIEEYQDVDIDSGKLYGVKDLDTVFIADEEVYPNLDEGRREITGIHEGHHAWQYDEHVRWGDALKHEYNLSDRMVGKMNEIDRKMELSKHPILGLLIDDELLTFELEGYTQRITEAMHEEGEDLGEGFYPVEKRYADKEMKEVVGVDPKKEFDPEYKPVEPETPDTPMSPGQKAEAL